MTIDEAEERRGGTGTGGWLARCWMGLVVTLVVFVAPACRSTDGTAGGEVPLPAGPAVSAAVGGGDSDALRTGDKLEVFVMEDESFNGVYPVREKGDIIMPKVGRIQVGGLSVSGAERRIEDVLEGAGNQLKQATVIADRIERARLVGGGRNDGAPRVYVFLTGSVNRPGQHAVPVSATGGRSGFTRR